MGREADLVIARHSVLHGNSVDAASYVLLGEQHRPFRRRDDRMIVVLGPDGTAVSAEQECRELLDLAQHHFAQSEGRSTTSRLRGAVAALHHHLRRRNDEALAGDKLTISTVMAALRPQGAYLALAGSAFACRYHDGALQRFYPEIPEPEGEEAAADSDEIPPAWRLLGGSQEPQPTLALAELAPGDTLILATGDLWLRVPDEDILRALHTGDPETALAALARAYTFQERRPSLALCLVQHPRISGLDDLPPDTARPPAGGEQWRRRLVIAPPGEEEPGFRRRDLVVAVLASLVILLGLFVFVLGPRWLGPRDESVQYFQTAENLLREVQASPDPSTARPKLQEARDLAQAALALRDDPTYHELADRIASELDRVDNVVRVQQPRLLVSYESMPEGSSVVSLVRAGSTLYVLDSGLGRVYRYPLAADGREVAQQDAHEVVLERGQNVGGAAVGDLVAMAWTPPGQLRPEGGLLIVDTLRTFVTYTDGSGLARIQPARSEIWKAIQAVAGFNGAVYLLDTGREELLVYDPTRTGYDSPPAMLLDSSREPRLKTAVDVAVDGSVYLLDYQSGVLKFGRDGQPIAFPGTPPDTPLRAPAALFAQGGGSAVWVADSGNERVVEFSTEGAYRRQYRLASGDDRLRGMRSLQVDEANRVAYVLTHRGIVAFDLLAPN